jgi:hypothetical protein
MDVNGVHFLDVVTPLRLASRDSDTILLRIVCRRRRYAIYGYVDAFFHFAATWLA